MAFVWRATLWMVGAGLAVGAWVYSRKVPQRYLTMCLVATFSAAVMGFAAIYGMRGTTVLMSFSHAIQYATLIGLWVFASCWYNGSRMQSFRRAAALSCGLADDLAVPGQTSMSVATNRPKRTWDAFAVTSGLPDQAHMASSPVLWYYLVSNALVLTWVFMLTVESHLLLLGFALVALHSAPVVGQLLARRVVFAGQLGAETGQQFYQAIDPISPWIGVMPEVAEALFVYRTGSRVWVGYPCSRSPHHTLIIAVGDTAPPDASVPQIDKATWQRMRWLGVRHRPKSQS